MLLACLLVLVSALLAPEGRAQLIEGSAPANLPSNGKELTLLYSIDWFTISDYYQSRCAATSTIQKHSSA